MLAVRPLSFPTDPQLLGWSLAAGGSLFISSLCTLCVVHVGIPLYWTTLMSSIGILIPIISSVFLFSENIRPLQILGIMLLFYGIKLTVASSHTEKIHISPKTVLLLITIFVAEGSTMLSQKCFAVFMPEDDPSWFSLLAFAIAAFFTGATYLILRLKVPKKQAASNIGLLCAYGGAQALSLLAIMVLSTVAASLVPAVIQFSLQAGGSLIISVLVSAFAFHQVPSKKNQFGITVCIAALIIVNAF